VRPNLGLLHHQAERRRVPRLEDATRALDELLVDLAEQPLHRALAVVGGKGESAPKGLEDRGSVLAAAEGVRAIQTRRCWTAATPATG
jgi:hypothetical protein